MDRRLAIELDAKLDTALARLARKSGTTKGAIVRDVLRRHVAVLRYRELRSRVLPFAEAQGLLTDEDCFRALSQG